MWLGLLAIGALACHPAAPHSEWHPHRQTAEEARRDSLVQYPCPVPPRSAAASAVDLGELTVELPNGYKRTPTIGVDTPYLEWALSGTTIGVGWSRMSVGSDLHRDSRVHDIKECPAQIGGRLARVVQWSGYGSLHVSATFDNVPVPGMVLGIGGTAQTAEGLAQILALIHSAKFKDAK